MLPQKTDHVLQKGQMLIQKKEENESMFCCSCDHDFNKIKGFLVPDFVFGANDQSLGQKN